MYVQSDKPFRSIKTKLILAVLALTIVLTAIIIFLNYNSEYNKDISTLDQKLQQIEETSIPSIATVVWNLDQTYLSVQAESIVKIKDIVKVKVVDASNRLMVEAYHDKKVVDVESNPDIRIYNFPLYHANKRLGTNEYLGTVEIAATTANIKAEILERVKLLIIAEIIKTFLLTYFILMIIHHYVNKNLEKIIAFARKFNPELTESNYLLLPENKSRNDELDILQDAINRMIQQLNFLNKEKEKKISEQERKIEMQQAAAITSAKMAALGEMAGGIAHEINNPLTIIHTNAKIMERMIEKGIDDQDIFLKSSNSIIKTIGRIGNIINGLKNVSRDVSTEKRAPVVFRNVLQDTISLCEEKFKYHEVKILCDLDKPIFGTVINCFQVQLSQVFLNLFNNSFDAIVNLPEKWIQIEATKDNHWLIIDFIDSGKGIPDEIVNKIFQPFFTTKDIGKGTGLGLSLIYGIIKNHDGDIEYREHSGNTSFRIRLPLKG